MCCSFFVKIYFNFREIIFFRSTAQICKFSSWISYPSCVTSCDEYTWPPVFLQHNPLFYLLNLIPCHYWSWRRNIYFLDEYFSDILFLCRIVASKQNSSYNDRLDRTYWASSFWQTKGWLKIYCRHFLVYLCCSIVRRTQSPAKFTYWASKYEK